jgi:AAA+ ATPase superfamily predicted ATPase
MLFSVRPKERREELYDFEKELEELKKGVRGCPLTVLVGMRRTGKTSLLKVALSELGNPYVYLDTRLSANPTYRDFMNIVRESLEGFVRRYAPLRRRVAEVLRGVRGLSITLSPPSVDVVWRGGGRLEFSQLLTALNVVGSELGEPVIIAFDEAQELRKVGWVSFTRLFAYAYDNLENVRIVLTGSEVGLLLKFLGVDRRESPLYGRYVHVVTTKETEFRGVRGLPDQGV